jgi:hypothetical protein
MIAATTRSTTMQKGQRVLATKWCGRAAYERR